MEKNTAGKWVVFAYGLPSHGSPGLPITGDAANITANVRIDGGAANAVDDTNPTELEDGYYIFDITSAEANGDNILLTPQSSTGNVQVIAVPGALWTRPADFSDQPMRGTDSAATASALSTAQSDLDIITDSDGVIIGAAGIDLVWDEILTAGHNTNNSSGKILRLLRDSGGYIGKIWIDTVDGNAGTSEDENGTFKAPVDTLTDALTLAAGIGGVHTFNFSPDSSWTMLADFKDSVTEGYGYGIAGAGYDFSGTHFIHTSPTTGVFLSATAHVDFVDSIIGNVTVNDSHFTNSTFTGTVTMGAVSSTLRIIGCRTVSASGATFDFGTSSSVAHAVVANDFNGNLTISNFGNSGVDTMIITGGGEITIDSSCTSGTIDIHGDWHVIDNGSCTITYDDSRDDLIDILADTAAMQPLVAKIPLSDGSISWNSTALGAINAEADTAISDASLATATNLATVDNVVDAILVDTAVIGAAGAGLTDLGGMSTAMKAEVLVEVLKVLVTQMSESYASDGSDPTLTQALMLIQQALTEFTISGTTTTIKKVDGSATAATLTLNDGTTPTGVTRAS